MKVTLTAYTPDPVRQMYLAAKRCTTANLDVNEDVDREEMERVVKNCIRAGHLTVCEFATFNFHIEQITRSCSHQLVRHRHASFCQQSQRRVKIGTPEEYSMVRNTIDDVNPISWPKEEAAKIIDKYFSITCNDNELKQAIMDSLFIRFCDYWELIQCGLAVEQARAVLPECTYTNLMMSVNFRELMHICSLRMCIKAEAEIKQMCVKILEAVADIQGGPFLLQFLRPKCFQNERCNEAKPCGIYKWEK